MCDEFKKLWLASNKPTEKKPNEKVTVKLNDYKKELTELYTKAVTAARAKKVDEYREMLKGGTLTEAERQRYTDLVVSPNAIPVEALAVDYDENVDRAAELANLIMHPEAIEEESNRSEFIKHMEGYAERHANK